MKIQLVDVYASTSALSRKPKDEAIDLLYRLILEREHYMNISHKVLPTVQQHKAFVECEPYLEWLMIKNETGAYVGATYVTRNMEVGLFVLKAERGKGYGTATMNSLKLRYPKTRLLANIAPTNDTSRAFFAQHGFKLLQETYELQR